jgi:hypothetical protein
VVAHINSVETKSVWSWVNWEMVGLTKCNIGVECGRVSGYGTGIESATDSNCTFMFEMRKCPGLTKRLPGRCGDICIIMRLPPALIEGVKNSR